MSQVPNPWMTIFQQSRALNPVANSAFFFHNSGTAASIHIKLKIIICTPDVPEEYKSDSEVPDVFEEDTPFRGTAHVVECAVALTLRGSPPPPPPKKHQNFNNDDDDKIVIASCSENTSRCWCDGQCVRISESKPARWLIDDFLPFNCHPTVGWFLRGV